MKQPKASLRPFFNNSVNKLAIMLIFGALVFAGTWFPGAYECFHYDRDGIQAEGIVTGHTGASYFGHSPDYFLTYRYFDRNKIPHIGKDTVEYPQRIDILDNTRVDVIYLWEAMTIYRMKRKSLGVKSWKRIIVQLQLSIIDLNLLNTRLLAPGSVCCVD